MIRLEKKSKEKEEENKVISSGVIIKFVVCLAGLLLGIAVTAKALSKKTSLDTTDNKKQLEENKIELPKVEQKVDWVRLYEEKCDLEQKMVRLAGGDTGMIAYKNILEKSEILGNSRKEANMEMYRNAYKRKYEHFRTSYARYTEILKAAEACPEDMRNMFLKSRDEDIYQDLLKFNP